MQISEVQFPVQRLQQLPHQSLGIFRKVKYKFGRLFTPQNFTHLPAAKNPKETLKTNEKVVCKFGTQKTSEILSLGRILKTVQVNTSFVTHSFY